MRPDIRVVGACPALAPAMAESWRRGRPVAIPDRGTCAEGISGSRPEPATVRRLRALVDDMVLVGESELLSAMRLIARSLGLLVEPSAVAGVAAVAGGAVPGRFPATVLTGTHPRPELLRSLFSD
jgi:threonine dehydratase